MNAADAGREARLAEIVGAVVRQALRDGDVSRVALMDDGSPEAALADRWLRRALGDERVVPVAAGDQEVESVLRSVGATASPDAADEVRRLRARLVPDALAASPVNKTALLLGGRPPPDPLLPLGDLYASEVAEMCGGWSAPETVRRLADRCGGIDRLDEALRRRFDGRDPEGLRLLPDEVRPEVRAALAAGCAGRTFGTIVPKLGARTIGVDLFE